MSKHKYSKEFLEKTGLKLEEINPAKAESIKEEAKEELQLTLTEKALGLHRVKDKDSNNYTYYLVEISYDPVLGAAGGDYKVLMETRSKEEVVNNFKFRVDDLNLFYYEK